MSKGLRKSQITTIPIDQINVMNPRVRNKKIFYEITENIAQVGLKRPITVKPVVIMDLYKHSITAHQSIILAESNTGIDHKRLLDRIISSLPEPDLIIYFQGDINLMKKRLTNRSDIYNDAYFAFIGQTKAVYETIIADCKTPMVTLPATNTIDENYKVIRQYLRLA